MAGFLPTYRTGSFQDAPCAIVSAIRKRAAARPSPNFVTLTRAGEMGFQDQPLAARDLFGKTDVLIIEYRKCGYRVATLAKIDRR